MGGGSGAADAVFVCASRRPQCAGDANCRLATPTAGGAIQSQLHGAACSDAPSKPILAATPARSISLPRPAIANGAPLSETKVKADLASRLSVRSARHSSPSSHLSRSAANSDIPIKQLSPNTVGQIDGVYSRDAPSFYLSETKVKADLASRLSVRSARHSSPSSRLLSVTICREFRHSDQTIKSEHGGTDRRRLFARRPVLF